MNQELIEYLNTHKIEILRPILDKKDGNESVGNCLRTKDMDNYLTDFNNLVYYLATVDKTYYAVNGYNFKDRIHNIYIHKIY